MGASTETRSPGRGPLHDVREEQRWGGGGLIEPHGRERVRARPANDSRRGDAPVPAIVDRSPDRFALSLSTVPAGEPPAEEFDRLPPRQLGPSLSESWRYVAGSLPRASLTKLTRRVYELPRPCAMRLREGTIFSDERAAQALMTGAARRLASYYGPGVKLECDRGDAAPRRPAPRRSMPARPGRSREAGRGSE